MPTQRGRIDLTRGGEDGKGDREVEGRPFFAQSGRRKIDHNPCLWKFELGRRDSTAHSLLRLLAGAVGQPDDGQRGLAAREMGFDFDPSRLQSDERVCSRASDHASTVERQVPRVSAL